MHLFTLAFLGGIIFLQSFTCLPSLWWEIGAFLLSLVLIKWVKSRLRVIGMGFLLGFGWALYFAHSIAAFSLPKPLEGEIISIKGVVDSIPSGSSQNASFLFRLQSLNSQKVTSVIRLNWQNPPPELTVGDVWLLSVKMKRIHGSANPGGFDYEAWAFQNRIRASGYVVTKIKPQFIESQYFSYAVSRFRQWVSKRVDMVLPSSKTSHWIVALMIGERSNIASSEWEVLRNTGCNHLMAIGGLHIGIIVGMVYALVRRLWGNFSFLSLYLSAQQGAALISLMVAWFYSALAGFSIPTQRAALMITVFLLARFFKRALPQTQGFWIALLGVLIINPLDVLSGSFWLSFLTIALILYGMGGRYEQSWWWRWGRAQWVIALGLLPLSIWLFSEYSLVSFIANSIAIPWVGVLVLPFCFMADIALVIFPPLAKVLLVFADKNLSILWFFLSHLSQLHFATWIQSVPNLSIILSAIIGTLVLLLPRGFPGRWLGLALLLPILLFHPAYPHFGEMKFTLLDVGQGLSAVIETQHHTLIFDTGARFNDHSDMGESVVLPFLHAEHITKLDMMVISHGDNDHRGGAAAILKKLPVTTIKTSVPYLFNKADLCLAGEKWEWDGVAFMFLHPTPNMLNQGNNSSCVLKVVSIHASVLLPGDLEKQGEKQLIEKYGKELRADIIVAPHHGSKTSSLEDFIALVQPRIVLYSTGYLNRYRFPHGEVVEAYKKQGAHAYNTASSGSIQLQGVDKLHLYRLEHGHYWMS